MLSFVQAHTGHQTWLVHSAAETLKVLHCICWIIWHVCTCPVIVNETKWNWHFYLFLLWPYSPKESTWYVYIYVAHSTNTFWLFSFIYSFCLLTLLDVQVDLIETFLWFLLPRWPSVIRLHIPLCTVILPLCLGCRRVEPLLVKNLPDERL